ncbi:MAG: cysteine--tRNA ligase [Thiobacillaceae bacterium]
MLQIHNSLTRIKEDFIPLEAGRVRMYVCGMTVYDLCHLGHARVFVVFDMVTRWLRASGYAVEYIRNITDIDDKIIRRAEENGELPTALTERFIAAMHEDERALGVLPPNHEPRATHYVAQMLAMIGQLEAKDLAYAAANGDVYYRVRGFAGYGQLSGKSLDELRAGERVEVDKFKHDPLDFVLWKAAKPGEPAWESPWGLGRPGWHIECSAMSEELLGKHFDIHGGGQDLQFPHHENEIAQSEGAHDCKFVNYWMHNGFVRVDNEKMSKSLGNFFTIREVLEKYDPEVVRFFILRAQYRSQLNYSDAHLDDARASLTRLYTALRGCDALTSDIDWSLAPAASFKAAMDDDFNTPVALAVLFELAGEANRGNTESANLLRVLAATLGLLQRDAEAFLKAGASVGGMAESDIEALIAARQAARKARDFAESDRIRDALTAAGVILEDAAGSTSWRRV